MPAIKFINRYTQAVEEEKVYGESYLRWTYESALGKIALWILLRRAFFSAWYGWRMSAPKSTARIDPFIENYGLDEREFLESKKTFRHFNDFFYRKLKSEARPIVGDEDSAISFPADGRHFGMQNVSQVERIYAKGQAFSVGSLLGDFALAETFAGGTAIISRLCPVDYHRYHSPVSGKIVEQKIIGGHLYSVSPIALSQKIDYLWRNTRVLTILDCGNLGQVAFVAIGATCVGSIKMTAKVGDFVSRGGELGFFEFGGSCVISVFQPGKVKLASDLVEAANSGLELYAKVNDRAGDRL
ncbi:phosphatidylserine decarboxylase [Puniceicoccaceae bacterium K14]|nr:phosphatidylserine decarboxylase [Puniceicoccaceae bacterium K14]